MCQGAPACTAVEARSAVEGGEAPSEAALASAKVRPRAQLLRLGVQMLLQAVLLKRLSA